jgi:porin
MSAQDIINRPATMLAALFAATLPVMAEEASGPNDSIPEQSIAHSLPGNGDAGGHRKRLADQGITYGLNYIGEVQGNLSGGIARRTVYVGRLEGYVDLDFEKLAGWKGLSVHANAYQLHGDGLSTNYLGNMMTVSFIEAHPTTRLFELWAEQRLFNDMLSVRFGQLATDSEFFLSGYAGQFVNASFGWPAIYGMNMPSGGPAYPLETPGVRLKLDPSKNLSILAAVFNGDPSGICQSSDDPQECNRYGLNFRTSDPPLMMSELQYRYNQEKNAPGLAGTIKVGGWYHFGDFDDRRFGTDGVLLADTVNSNGIPVRHRGNSGIYGVIDQQIWRPASGEPDKGVGMFARISVSPDSDRNDVGLYVDGGIVFAGLIPGRPDDVVSLGAAFAKASSDARDADRDAITFGALQSVRDYEALLEANYQAQIMSGWTVTGDFQYVWHPGANVAHPNRTDGAPIGDAALLTLHSVIKY